MNNESKPKNRKVTILVILGAIFGILMMVFVAIAGAGASTTPMLTWGYAQIDGEPIPINAQVDVYIGSDLTPSGSSNTTVPGYYGSMMVTGDSSRYGEELHYTLNDLPTTKIGISGGSDPGIFGLENQQVMLYALSTGIPVEPTHTWTFYNGGFFPKHLPDYFAGTVNLSAIEDVPWQIQGVYYWNDITWLFWCPNAPGTTLAFLEGGLVADYMVVSAGNCTWEIPLQ